MSKKAGRMASEAMAVWPGGMVDDGINEMAVAVLAEQRIADELARLSVDETLSDVERAKLFLTPGAHVVQQLCAMAKLPQLFREHGKAAVVSLAPMLGLYLEQTQPAMQIACAEALQRVFSDGGAAAESVSLLLPLVLRVLGQARADTITEAWLAALCAAMPKLPPKVVREDLLAFALSKGRVEEAPCARAACATMLGGIAALKVLDTRDLQATLLKKTAVLCQDTDASVRAAMCCQLGSVARGVRPEDAAGSVVVELMELLSDEQASVRAAATATLVGMLDELGKEGRKQKGVPIFKGLCALTDPPLLPTFARLFGEMLWKLRDEVGEEELQAAADAYKSMARKTSDEILQVCAWNLPGVAKVMSARRYALHVHPTLMHLAQDASAAVRRTVAAGLHEVMAVLGPERSAQYLREPYLLLLRDAQPEVLGALLPTLGVAMTHFSIANVTQRAAIYGAFVPTLQQAMRTTGHAWRMHKAFMDAAASFHLYFSSAQIWEQFLPLCFQLLDVGAAPVRAAAAAALASLMRHNKRAAQRADIASRLVREYAEGASAAQRLLFLDFCAACRKVASTQLFRDYFLHAAVDLLQDPVVCVRARACAFLPLLKAAIRLPDDVAVLERLNMAASQRMNDADAAVSAAARAVAEELKRVPVRCIGAIPTTGSAQSQLEADAADLKREEEEWSALSKEEQDEKRRLDEAVARARAELQQPLSPTSAHPRNGKTLDSAAARALNRAASGGRAATSEPGVVGSKYAVQRSQGSADQAAMVALSSAAMGHLTIRTSGKERPGERNGRGRAGSAEAIQPGSPWPIAASAQRMPTIKPPLPTSPTRSAASGAAAFPPSPSAAAALNGRNSGNGSLTPATAAGNGQPLSPTSPTARKSVSVVPPPLTTPSFSGTLPGHSTPAPSPASVRSPTGQWPGQPSSSGRSLTGTGAPQISSVGKGPDIGVGKLTTGAGVSGSATTVMSPKAAKSPSQPRLAFGSSSVKVTTSAVGPVSPGAAGDSLAKVGENASKEKVGSIAGIGKAVNAGAEKPNGANVKRTIHGSVQRAAVPTSSRKPF